METVVEAATAVAEEVDDQCADCNGCCDLSTAEQVEKKKTDPDFEIEDPSANERACVGRACLCERLGLSCGTSETPSPSDEEADFLSKGARFSSLNLMTLSCIFVAMLHLTIF